MVTVPCCGPGCEKTADRSEPGKLLKAFVEAGWIAVKDNGYLSGYRYLCPKHYVYLNTGKSEIQKERDEREEVARLATGGAFFESPLVENKKAVVGFPGRVDEYSPETLRAIETLANGAKQSRLEGRSDLLPPRALLRLAEILKAGAVKYGEENWRGIPIRDNLNHAMTHILLHLKGDTSEDHVANAACRMLFALDLVMAEREKEKPSA